VELRDVLVRVHFLQRIAVRHRTGYDNLFVYNEKMTDSYFFFFFCAERVKTLHAGLINTIRYYYMCVRLNKNVHRKIIYEKYNNM